MSFDVIIWVMHHSEETLGRRLVLLALAENANDDGSGAWPSVETLARKAQLSPRQVKRCLKGLSEDGAIVSEGKGPYGTESWCVAMASEDKLSSEMDKLSSEMDKLSSENGQIVTQTCPIEPVQEPGRKSPDLESDPVTVIFERWRTVTGHPRARLDASRRRAVTRALKIASAEECLLAIEGCGRRDWNMGRGEHQGNPSSYHALSLILRDREKIEGFMQGAEAARREAYNSSVVAATIKQAKLNVLAAYDLAGSSEMKSKGDEGEAELARHGIEVLRRSDGRPYFVE